MSCVLYLLSPYWPWVQVLPQEELINEKVEETMSDAVLKITDDGFETDVLKSDKPTLVDFWAEWCGPCRALTPIINEIATTYEGRLHVAKMNIDENPSTPSQYGVRAIPTLLLFKDGEVQEQLVGLVTKDKLSDILEKHC